MKNKMICGVGIGAIAALALAGSAMGQNAASVVARAIEVRASGVNAMYQLEAEGGQYVYDWTDIGQNDDVVTTYFTVEKNNTTPSQAGRQVAITNAFAANACNFWCGRALVETTHTQSGNTWTIAPLADYIGANAPDPKTGWTPEENGEAGEIQPILITIDDIFIAEQKVLHHRPKPKGNRPWNTKISFDLQADDVKDLRIEIVHLVWDEDENEYVEVLEDILGTHEYVAEYVDWDFHSSGLQWGNPDALAQVVDGALVSHILQGHVGGDDFHGNNNETGGWRVRVDPAVPLTYLVEAPGDYTLRISGIVRGNALDGTADQSFNVTLVTVAVDPCDCDE